MEGETLSKPGRLAARTLDTRSAPRREREEVWEAILTPVTTPDRLWKQPFGGRIDAWQGSDAMLCDVQADQQITRRGARQLSLGPPPLYTLMLVCHGKLRYQDGMKDVCLMPGDVMVEDMAAARTLVTQRHRTLQLILPYSASGMALPMGLHGEVLPRRHTATRLLARHLLALRRIAAQITAEAFGRQLDVAIHLLMAALPATKRRGGEMSRLQHAIRREIEGYIEANLTLPDLNAAHVRTVFRMSRNQLYRLFRHSGGPSAYIQLRRLQAASQHIQRQRERPDQWGYIAETFGFRSAAALDTTLRHHFDSSLEQLAARVDDPHSTQPTETVEALFQRLPDERHTLNSNEG